LLNKVICVVEYLEDGISMNKNKHYVRHPNGFIEFRKLKMEVAPNFQSRFRHAMHLVSSCIFAKRIKDIFIQKYIFNILLAFPFGVMLNFYIRKSNRRNFNKELN